jgi:two-component sensor histidine kinase
MDQLSGKSKGESLPLQNKPGWWYKIINYGVRNHQGIVISDKLRSRNILSALCILFSLTYVAYFLKELQLLPLSAILLGIFVFYLTILYNHLERYRLSSVLLLLNTNYCVLFFSVYLGFDSGIHLYLFTSPLIILTLFDIKNYRFLFIAMSSYLINFIVIVFIGKYLGYHTSTLEPRTLSFFYLINFSSCIFIILTLTLHFYKNNKKVNHLLILKNRELELQQVELEKENKTRRIAEEQANSSLLQKEVLLSEIHHRVKNNLAVISGLMELQGFFINDRYTLEVFKESKGRVKALALLFEKLYENNTLERVNLDKYMDELLKFNSKSYTLQNASVRVETVVFSNCELGIQEATPVALMLNELVSNSFKHAFKGRTEGRISISFLNYNNEYILSYSDDGAGYKPQPEDELNSLGINLIDSFSKQLNGKYEFTKDKGTTFTFKFPVN